VLSDELGRCWDVTGSTCHTAAIGNDTAGIGNDTAGIGNDTAGIGNDTAGIGTHNSCHT